MGRLKLQKSPSIRRMPTYLHKLMLMRANGEVYASATRLAEYVSLDPIIVRKDFELTDVTGQPGVGYRVDELLDAIRRFLGWNVKREACLVGAGSLGSAILGYEEFAEYGLVITSVFDSAPHKIGTIIHGHEVLDVRMMSRVLAPRTPDLAIICVSGNCAQMVADELVACGVKAFWNFANVCLSVPDDVVVQREVIAGGFAMLSVKLARAGRGDDPETTEGVDDGD